MHSILVMRMSEGIEWALHCCTVLAFLPDDESLPAARLAEFHGVPGPYLAKHLQALTRAGITTSTSGPRGGFRLAGPATEITLLDVVLAIDGDDPAFTCTEIRRNGPQAETAVDYEPLGPCGIATAMWRAEDAWRRELAGVSIADLTKTMLDTVPEEQLTVSAVWLEGAIKRRSTS